MNRTHDKVLLISGTVAVLMFFFSFALVPIYSLLCKATGINTAVLASELSKPSRETLQPIDVNRTITVQFIVIKHQGMAWEFYPKVKNVRVHPGESVKVIFYAKNKTNETMTAQAIPSMTPTEAISHFHKIECFCFKRQSLQAGESKAMVLVFQVDQAVPKTLHVITLAYTLFDVTGESRVTDA